MKKKLAVYAGTFDPPTLGHLWVIEQAAEIFERLIVAIGTNPKKDCMFSVKERLEILRKSTAHIPNIQIESYPNQYLINYAQSVGARFIVRGIRSVKDYEYESNLGDFNSKIGPKITTIFMMPPQGIADVSSSRVKELTGPEGWEDIMKMYVPDPALEKLKEAHRMGLMKQQWFALWERIDAKGDASIVLDDLAARYREPHRHYHALPHIDHCLTELKQARKLILNHNAVEMAIWFHDAIYDTKAKDNEGKSAELAKTVLENAGLSEEFTKQAVNLILATKHIAPPADPDAKLIADIDLSSLGIADEAFDENGRQIREEYKEVPEELFMAGRSAFLDALLKRKTIYYTQFFFEKYEAQARKNLIRAITQLSK